MSASQACPVQTKEPEHPRKFNPSVDRDLATICLKCLEKEPQRRSASALTMAEDLERWRAGEPIQARAVKWTWRNPQVAAATCLICGRPLPGLAWLAGGKRLWAQTGSGALASAPTH